MVLKANGLDYEIRFNDIPLDKGTGAVDTEFPLNQWTFTGINTLSASAKGSFEHPSHLSMSVYVKEMYEVGSDPILLMDIVINGCEGKPVLEQSMAPTDALSPIKIVQKEPETYIVLRKCELEVPFKDWLWIHCKTIPDTRRTFDELLACYQEFHRLLKAKNRKIIEEKMQPALKEYMGAYFITDYQQALDDFEIMDLMNDSGLKLANIVPDQLDLKVFGKGRLASLLNKQNGESPIFFDQLGMKIHIDMAYCKKYSDWIQIR